MASPFPGMDPYLEQSAFWASFHSRLIVALADAIEAQLQPDYYVEVETRTYLSEGEGSLLIGIPNVVATDGAQDALPRDGVQGEGRVAVQVRPQAVQVPMPEEVKERYLDIREMATGDVVTALEVLSPKNKRPGQGRQVYEEKRRQVLGSLTHLVEIDLLRAGSPMAMVGTVSDNHYRLLVSASHQRPRADLYAFSVRDPLPDLPIPLRPNDKLLVLDLQTIVAGIYDRGRYFSRIDYRQPPPPPALTESDQQWVTQRLQP